MSILAWLSKQRRTIDREQSDQHGDQAVLDGRAALFRDLPDLPRDLRLDLRPMVRRAKRIDSQEIIDSFGGAFFWLITPSWSWFWFLVGPSRFSDGLTP